MRALLVLIRVSGLYDSAFALVLCVFLCVWNANWYYHNSTPACPYKPSYLQKTVKRRKTQEGWYREKAPQFAWWKMAKVLLWLLWLLQLLLQLVTLVFLLQTLQHNATTTAPPITADMYYLDLCTVSSCSQMQPVKPEWSSCQSASLLRNNLNIWSFH